MAALEFFLNLERLRHTDIEKYKDKSSIIVMDRSVISLLGFRFAERVFGSLDIFTETKAIIKQEPQLAPDYVVYLYTTDELIEERLKKSRRKVGSMFTNPEFNRQLRVFFEWLIERREYEIITVDTNKAIDEVKKEVITIADKL